jgi:predicted histone-like DNA-binding protein
MPILYKAVRRKNPRNLEAGPKYYPNPVYRQRMNLHELGELIGTRTAFSQTDVIGVLSEMSRIIPEFLSQGYIIELEDFGTFRITFEGTPAEKEEDVTSANIKSIRYNFLPGDEFKMRSKIVKFEKAKASGK